MKARHKKTGREITILGISKAPCKYAIQLADELIEQLKQE